MTTESTEITNGLRRRLLGGLITGGGLVALGKTTASVAGDPDQSAMPGDEPRHKVVYQFNHAEPEYHDHVLGSVGAMLRQYQDDIRIVVTCFAQGIHILAKNPQRPVAADIRERVSSLAMYGVEFHACGRTLASLNWGPDDLLPFAKIVSVGAADLMELQEQNYAYIVW